MSDNTSQVRVLDYRQTTWFRIDNAVFRRYLKVIKHSGYMVYSALAMHANERIQSWPSMRKLAEECDLCEQTVKEALERLKECGLVSVSTRHRSDGSQTSNLYTLLTVPDNPPPGITNIPPGRYNQDAPLNYTHFEQDQISSDIRMSEEQEPDVSPPAVSVETEPVIKRQRAKKEPNPLEHHPVIELLKKGAYPYPKGTIYEALVGLMGNARLDEEWLKEVRGTWLSRGHNPMNWAGVVSWYLTGIPPQYNSPGKSPPPNIKPKPPEEVPRDVPTGTWSADRVIIMPAGGVSARR